MKQSTHFNKDYEDKFKELVNQHDLEDSNWEIK